jgi:hypothetical protein
MAHNLIQIASFSFPHEANIAKASLEAANIPASIADEHMINMDWLMSDALGGVRLFVPVQFEVEARALIEQDYSYLVEQEFEGIAVEKNICPSCGSTELEDYTIGKKPTFITILLFGFPLFFYKQGVRCINCGTISRK